MIRQFIFFFSVDTLNSHVQGVKHVKKKIAMEAKNDALRSKGLAPETKVVRQVMYLDFVSVENPLKTTHNLQHLT